MGKGLTNFLAVAGTLLIIGETFLVVKYQVDLDNKNQEIGTLKNNTPAVVEIKDDLLLEAMLPSVIEVASVEKVDAKFTETQIAKIVTTYLERVSIINSTLNAQQKITKSKKELQNLIKTIFNIDNFDVAKHFLTTTDVTVQAVNDNFTFTFIENKMNITTTRVESSVSASTKVMKWEITCSVKNASGALENAKVATVTVNLRQSASNYYIENVKYEANPNYKEATCTK